MSDIGKILYFLSAVEDFLLGVGVRDLDLFAAGSCPDGN